MPRYQPIHLESTPISLPSWEELTQFAKSTDLWSSEVEELKLHPPPWRYRLARFILTISMRDPSYQKFLRFGWGDVVDLIVDQVARNRTINKGGDDPDHQPVVKPINPPIIRPFNQLPCTLDTARRRAEVATTLVSREAQVLLLGDDDLVSTELAKRGFKNITVIDIDQRVINCIRAACAVHGWKIDSIRHDLNEPISDLMRGRHFDLVFMDPVYSVAGVKTFLSAAVDLTAGDKQAFYFLSIHLMSLLRSGIPGLEKLLSDFGLEIFAFEQGFNSYPVPNLLRRIILFTNTYLLRAKSLTTSGFRCPFFLSDALILRKQ